MSSLKFEVFLTQWWKSNGSNAAGAWSVWCKVKKCNVWVISIVHVHPNKVIWVDFNTRTLTIGRSKISHDRDSVGAENWILKWNFGDFWAYSAMQCLAERIQSLAIKLPVHKSPPPLTWIESSATKGNWVLPDELPPEIFTEYFGIVEIVLFGTSRLFEWVVYCGESSSARVEIERSRKIKIFILKRKIELL